MMKTGAAALDCFGQDNCHKKQPKTLAIDNFLVALKKSRVSARTKEKHGLMLKVERVCNK